MPEKQKSRSLGALSGIGFELAAAVAGFTLAGYFWDRHFGSSPWGVLIGAALGVIGGTYNMIRQSLSITREPSSENKKPSGDGER
jgi:F0F1-type ATP synthase assembly protein I